MQDVHDPDMLSALIGRRLLRCIERALDSTEAIASYLYGSYAREQQTPMSDLDLALLLPDRRSVEENGRLALRLSMGIAKCSPGIEVDVRVLNDLSLELRYRVISEGRLIHCRNESARVSFETRTLMEFLDFKPALDTYESYLHRRLEETDRL